jgi:hypothetical protein
MNKIFVVAVAVIGLFVLAIVGATAYNQGYLITPRDITFLWTPPEGYDTTNANVEFLSYQPDNQTVQCWASLEHDSNPRNTRPYYVCALHLKHYERIVFQVNVRKVGELLDSPCEHTPSLGRVEVSNLSMNADYAVDEILKHSLAGCEYMAHMARN